MDEEIIYESAIVAQFLVDSFPSPLLPSPREDPLAPLTRARINFFTDTWSTKLSSHQMAVMKAPSAEKLALTESWVAAVKKEIEPLLKGADQYFGGSKELTLAEAIVAPFLLRWYEFADDTFVPKALVEGLDKLPNFSKWSEKVRGHPSVTKIWDGESYKKAFSNKYGKVFEKM